MGQPEQNGGCGGLDFLRERLAHGNDCLMQGNARGALTYYDSALASFAQHRDDGHLRETWHALWNNKALAHQQLNETMKAQHAAMVANSLFQA